MPQLMIDCMAIANSIDPTPTVYTPGWAELRVQRGVGRLLCIPVYELIAFAFKRMDYKITNLKESRQQYREIFERTQKTKTPLVICANHLTFVDSCLMIWAFGSSAWYFKNYRAFSWNLPAGDFFKKKLFFRVVAYLGKCIFIHRDGERDHKEQVLKLCQKLVNGGEVLTVFPEGRRSRTGRFERDRMTYGTGKIVSSAKDCEVLCVYLRAQGQETFRNYPAKGARFHLEIRLLKPTLKTRGRRAYFEVLEQVGDTLLALEQAHFDRQ